MSAHGQNVWYELLTSSPAKARAFYSEVIGWSTKSWEDSDNTDGYQMWMVGEQPVGGVMQLPEEVAEMGAPPHWLAYTAVDDVDTSAAKAEKLGAKVLRAPFDIPQVGRICILADPQGATFAVYTPLQNMETVMGDKAGEFGWTELNTTDYEGAWKFYSELFGWHHTSSMDVGPAGTYFMFKDKREVTKGGMANTAPVMKVPPHWLYYVTVADIEVALGKVKTMGGKVHSGPMQVPGGGQVAQCEDPQGAVFAVFDGSGVSA